MRDGRPVPPSNVYKAHAVSGRGCSEAMGGRGEAGHPAQDPRCAPRHHLHGAVGATHRRPRSRWRRISASKGYLRTPRTPRIF
jgi:hypothetical protein